ncbi:hypothetical protein N7462_004413 [Penicillium macrosclerotiorum]|uniref:uncharacterized protein n=1 Tax=Penicillium macrosclerotiorum TaxID=303699 RepID=UPI0025485302|nr:uncharacterized protein N7462_004413 [Penicillium macrosclerotiorum]KAJ5690021.1 hypothetical protein N7462_004413 [Penicillium macrosclerotiorum]
MDDSDLGDIARQLSDLEVALLLSLVANEHCLFETTGGSIDDLAKELALICSSTFDLSYCILDCSLTTSIEDIHFEILTAEARKSHERPSYFRLKTGSSNNLSSYVTPTERDRSRSPGPKTPGDEGNVVNVIIAKNLNMTSDDFQVQMLQLTRARKLATESGVLYTPASFTLLPIVVRDGDQLDPPLKTHLNEHLFVSHFHDPADGYVYLENDRGLSDDHISVSSVIRKPNPLQKSAKVDRTIIDRLREMSATVTTNAEVVCYIQDIVVFLRLSRAVGGGISAKANNQLNKFARLLAPLHGIDYLTPSIVALAARKVFRHRIIVTTPRDDRSLQYGSDMGAVSHVLVHVTPDSILDGVLALEPPI